jgi:CopG family transcriptional regulator, nickel-responsive regulator
MTDDESEAMGVVTLIYDHHASRISRRLTDLQHDHLEQVVTTTHVHLDARRCLEVILLRGPARQIRNLADDLIGTKGVETGRLVLASAKPIPPVNGDSGHAHSHDDDHDHSDGHDHNHGHGHSHRHPHSHSRKTSRQRGS